MTSAIIVGLVSGFVAAFVAIWTTQAKISIENITQERAKWRDKVREKTLEVHNAIVDNDEKKIRQLKVEFSVILNPKDDKDNRIIELIKIPVTGEELMQSDEFSNQIAILLKHDWDRAKLESGSIFCRLKFFNKICKCLLQEPPDRKELDS